jgi:hypothetical protein
VMIISFLLGLLLGFVGTAEAINIFIEYTREPRFPWGSPCEPEGREGLE